MNRIPLVIAALLFSLPANAGDIWNSIGSSGTQENLGVYAIPVTAFGAKCDGKTLTDISITSGSTVASSSGYTFSSEDVGKRISVFGSGASGVALNTIITAVNSGNAVLASSAATTVTNTETVFGTNDTTAILTAISTVGGNGGGVLSIPPRTCIVSSHLPVYDKVSIIGASRSLSRIFWSTSADMTEAVFHGLSRSASTPYTDVKYSSFTIDARAAIQSVYSVAGKAFYIQYMTRPVFENLYIVGTPATSIGVDYIVDGIITKNIIEYAGRLNNGTLAGGAGIGIGTGYAASQERIIITENVIRVAGTYGIFSESQGLTDDYTKVIISNNIILMPTSGGRAGIGDSGTVNSIIVENNIMQNTKNPSSASADGISIDAGTYGAVRPGYRQIIANNVIRNMNNGIVIDYSIREPSLGTRSSYQIIGNSITGSTYFGIKFVSGMSFTIKDVIIGMNEIMDNKDRGISFTGTTALENISIFFNNIVNNVSAGIWFAVSANHVNIKGNNILNDSGGQTHGISNSATMTNVSFSDNVITYSGSALHVPNGSISGEIRSNTGYNPVGASIVSVGTSPWTYTAGTSPETLYLNGGTIASVTIDGVTVATGTPATVRLPPNKSAIVTYSSAPTASKFVE